MTEEELRKGYRANAKTIVHYSERKRKIMPEEMMNQTLEARLSWLEADASKQRRVILRLERQINHIGISSAIVAAVAGWLFGRSFT